MSAMHVIRVVVVGGALCPNACAQDTIPFTLTEHNNIVVEAMLNDQDTLQLMFHTDAADVGLTAEATVRVSSLTRTDSVEAISWGGEGNTANYSVGHQLRIGALSWDSLTVWTGGRSGHGTDGKFGPNLFDGKVMEIDFDESRMVIHSALPDLPKGFEKAPVHFVNGSMYLDGALEINEETYPQKFLIHSGYSGTLLIDDQFARKHELATKLTVTSESELSDSYGNTLKTKKALLPKFHLDDHSFTEMPIGFFEGHLGGEHRSVLGGELLKRFNWVLDLREEELYLKASETFGVTFNE